MARNRDKPYFTKEQVELLEVRFWDAMIEDKQNCNGTILAAFRKYATASKSEYENFLLKGVLDGRFQVFAKAGMATYAAKKPHNDDPKAWEQYVENDHTLQRHVQMLFHTGPENAGFIYDPATIKVSPLFPDGQAKVATTKEVVAIPQVDKV